MDIIIIVTFVALFGLIWGSFLNVLAYRITFNKPFFTRRSQCTVCENVISWYDNLPVISWILLRRKCRNCKTKISALYPIFEIITAFVFTLSFLKILPLFSPLYFYITTEPLMADSIAVPTQILSQGYFAIIAFFIFFSAVIAACRSDLEAMVIPQIFSVWLVPVGLILSYFGFTFISLKASIIGAVLGYLSLYFIAALFKYFTGKDGMGVGDMELLAMIGSFLGPFGIWFSLMIGSILGLVIGGLYLIIFHKDRLTRIPFGPFLALGATIYFLFDDTLIKFFFS